MNRLITVLLFAFCVCMSASAQDSNQYQCTMGEHTRRVQIMHETGLSVPCEVQYFKDSEAPGEAQVLWRALNEEGYCEAKATAFIAKLTEMGWDCGASAVSPEPEQRDSTPDAELIDDSDVLTPAEPVGALDDKY